MNVNWQIPLDAVEIIDNELCVLDYDQYGPLQMNLSRDYVGYDFLIINTNGGKTGAQV